MTPMDRLSFDIERAVVSENGDRTAADLYIKNKAMLFDSVDEAIRNSGKEFPSLFELDCVAENEFCWSNLFLGTVTKLINQVTK